jgi:hypothetical protein
MTMTPRIIVAIILLAFVVWATVWLHIHGKNRK